MPKKSSLNVPLASKPMLERVVQKYLELFPEDEPRLSLLFEQIKNGEDLSDRKNSRGHITGSGIIFSPDFKKVLLINHPSQGRWQQPGGHWDKREVGPWETAERESIEETGVKIAKKIHVNADPRIPLSINSHLIPARESKNEPEHIHHDFRYVYIAKSEDLKFEDDVIKEAAWFDLDAPENLIRKEVNRALSLLEK